MKRERNCSNVIFVTKVFLKRAICQNTLLLSMILTNHSNVIAVTKFSVKSNLKRHSDGVHERKKNLNVFMQHCVGQGTERGRRKF